MRGIRLTMFWMRLLMRGCYAAIPGNGFTSPMVGARPLEDVEDLLVYLDRPIEFAAQCELNARWIIISTLATAKHCSKWG
jgi:hypothetical protein